MDESAGGPCRVGTYLLALEPEEDETEEDDETEWRDEFEGRPCLRARQATADNSDAFAPIELRDAELTGRYRGWPLEPGRYRLGVWDGVLYDPKVKRVLSRSLTLTADQSETELTLRLP